MTLAPHSISDVQFAEPQDRIRTRKLSLRALLMAVSISISVLLCTTVASVLIVNARLAVADEIRSAFDFARASITASLPTRFADADIMRRAEDLMREIDARRHVAVEIRNTDGTRRGVDNQTPARPERESGTSVPAWFVASMQPEVLVDQFPITRYPNVLGTLRLVSDPSDEIAEVWEDFSLILPILLATGLLFVAMSFALNHLLMRRIRSLLSSLTRMCHGDLDVRATDCPLKEFSALANGVNDLAVHLQKETSQNRQLQARLLTLCENERARIAHDLHDEMGPQLFALGAAAGQARSSVAALREDGRDKAVDALSSAVEAIARHTASIQRSARNAINDLRPMVAGAASLVELLDELLGTFQETAGATRFILRGDTTARAQEMAELSIYRFVRESVLNALRHGQPDLVEVIVLQEAGMIVVQVSDSGRAGEVSFSAPSFGQLGMRDRASALGAIYRPPWREGARTITELRVPI
ncbi:LapD/MoxY N-terminal periplasmic domain-containing protein [Breoghania sp.]|uniref:sensor histidine kinase n=1 Tax=Breoghania sp. TaxID=2065378 RepID=UPI0029CA9833|nr:LapD/MoxY N-terminal periplasmic domain-containing protein [Breoghania sp.]